MPLARSGVFGFGGQAGYYRDAETDLYLLGGGGQGRYYDPALGRFTSADPLGVDSDSSANLYRYASNDPVNRIDPSGQLPTELAAMFAAQIGKAAVRGTTDPFENPDLIGKSSRELEGARARNSASSGSDQNYEFIKQKLLNGLASPTTSNQSTSQLSSEATPSQEAYQVTAAEWSEFVKFVESMENSPAQQLSTDTVFDKARNRYGFCATCHGSLDGNWKNVAAFPHRYFAADLEVHQLQAIEIAEASAERLSPDWRVPAHKVIGTLKVIGAAIEFAGGCVLVSGSFGLLTGVGAVLILHSSDTLDSGLRTLETGEIQNTYFSQGVQLGAEKSGYDPETAERIGESADLAVSMIDLPVGIWGLWKAWKSSKNVDDIVGAGSSVAPDAGSSSSTTLSSHVDELKQLLDEGAASFVDPQLDNNVLSHLANPSHQNHAAAVAYANANKAAGLSVNRHAYREFLVNFSKDQFKMLKDKYGIKLIREISLEEIEIVGKRIEDAFVGTDRSISASDARVAASALLRGEKLATNDLQFFKRA